MNIYENFFFTPKYCLKVLKICYNKQANKTRRVFYNKTNKQTKAKDHVILILKNPTN